MSSEILRGRTRESAQYFDGEMVIGEPSCEEQTQTHHMLQFSMRMHLVMEECILIGHGVQGKRRASSLLQSNDTSITGKTSVGYAKS
ncbi:hypothetical protein SLE2022_267470 [Rubroshorea leprosula]